MPNFDVSSEYVKCASVNIRFFLVLVFLDWFCESTICEKVLFLYFFFLLFFYSSCFPKVLRQYCTIRFALPSIVTHLSSPFITFSTHPAPLSHVPCIGFSYSFTSLPHLVGFWYSLIFNFFQLQRYRTSFGREGQEKDEVGKKHC